MAETMSPAPNAGTTLERSDALAQVNDWIREAQLNGEVEEGVIPDYLAELLAGAELDFKTKIERTGLAALRREQEADAIDAEIRRLQARKQTRKNEAERIRRYAHLCLEIAGETKVQGTLCTVSLQQNPPSVRGELSQDDLAALLVLDDAPYVKAIPASYALDKRALLERWKHGAELPPGLSVERSVSLRIR
jgi:hypothetical protein